MDFIIQLDQPREEKVEYIELADVKKRMQEFILNKYINKEQEKNKEILEKAKDKLSMTYQPQEEQLKNYLKTRIEVLDNSIDDGIEIIDEEESLQICGRKLELQRLLKNLENGKTLAILNQEESKNL